MCFHFDLWKISETRKELPAPTPLTQLHRKNSIEIIQTSWIRTPFKSKKPASPPSRPEVSTFVHQEAGTAPRKCQPQGAWKGWNCFLWSRLMVAPSQDVSPSQEPRVGLLRWSCLSGHVWEHTHVLSNISTKGPGTTQKSLKRG